MANDQSVSNDTKTKRVTIDLTVPASKEVDRLKEVTGLTTADIFRHALTLFRIYVKAKGDDSEVLIVNPSDPNKRTSIELPVEIEKR